MFYGKYIYNLDLPVCHKHYSDYVIKSNYLDIMFLDHAIALILQTRFKYSVVACLLFPFTYSCVFLFAVVKQL